MYDFVPMIQMAALVFTVINFFKAVRNGDTNAWTTQLIVWVSGVVVVFLVAQTDFAESVTFGEWVLSGLNFASLVFIGLTVASLATVGNELKKAFDNTDSAATPPLVVDKHQNADGG